MNQIESLIARDAIQTQLYLYCQGVDRQDWSLVRSCFGDEHVHEHGSFAGSADEFIKFTKALASNLKGSQHSISNVIIRFSAEGLAAQTETNFNAVHVITEELASRLGFDSVGNDADWIVAGKYKDEWVCRNGKWLIVERKATHHWERFELQQTRQSPDTVAEK